jgi:hypothetical protein
MHGIGLKRRITRGLWMVPERRIEQGFRSALYGTNGN